MPYCNRYDPNLSSLDDSIFPGHRDSEDFHQIVHNFVVNYVSNYDCVNDKECELFYYGLCKDLKIDTATKKNDFTKENLCSLISNLICVVTAWHEQVGSVFDVGGIELDWFDVKLYKKKSDKTQQSCNDFVAFSILIMLTGVRNPALLSDFTHVLLKDDKYKSNVQIFESFQNELKQLSQEIDQRNKTRRTAFNCVNPRVLECSVSI